MARDCTVKSDPNAPPGASIGICQTTEEEQISIPSTRVSWRSLAKEVEVEAEAAGQAWGRLQFLSRALTFIRGVVQRCGRRLELIRISRIIGLNNNNNNTGPPVMVALGITAAGLRRGIKDKGARHPVLAGAVTPVGTTGEARTTRPPTLNTTKISTTSRRRQLPSSNQHSQNSH